MRYIAFLRDQIEHYYPLHRSILNVYFAPSGNKFLDIIFDVRPEGIICRKKDSAFKKCCKRITKQINDEWNVGKGTNELSVGEILEKRGIKIKKYIFRNMSNSKFTPGYYTFPDGKSTNCQ